MTGQQLKEHLEKHGIKKSTFASRISRSPSAITNYCKSDKFRPKTEEAIKRTLITFGHPFEESKPSTFGTDKTDHTTLVRLTDLQREVNTLRELVDTQKKIIALLENK